MHRKSISSAVVALQISLSNPLTIPVTFRLETRGPFAINSTPSKKRLPVRKKGLGLGYQTGTATGALAATGNTEDSMLDYSRISDVATKHAAFDDDNGNPHAFDPSESTLKNSSKKAADGGGRMPGSGGSGNSAKRRGDGGASTSLSKSVKLLPGRNLQLELVFLPSKASGDVSAALQSSFTPGSEVYKHDV